MSQQWADRERRTNRLVRAVADFVFATPCISANQLYGLCKLSWITESHDGADAGYIRSTKIPALADVFDLRDYKGKELDVIASDIANLTGNGALKSLVLGETGFTNLYKPYRNTAREWIAAHRAALLPLFKAARKLKSDRAGLELVRKVSRLARIPKAGGSIAAMRPEYLLTPAFFCLDPRLRFPLINGNQGVQGLLRKLKAKDAPLEEQYSRLVDLYGQAGIKDAADLDQAGTDLPDFVPVAGQRATKKFLGRQKTEGKHLPLKDEKDLESLQKAKSVTSRRIHNQLTNKLRIFLREHTLLEGADRSALFDVLVRDYDGDDHDLMIEVKSSLEAPHIRMAIGQLMDYWFCVMGNAKRHAAILLPSKPNEATFRLLEQLEIGVLWFAGESLKTCSPWLRRLVSVRSPADEAERA